MNVSSATKNRQRLDSWKEIAEYLGRDVRTAMRWEQELGLPVHRVPGGLRRGVFAISEEIDAWIAKRGQSSSDPMPEPARQQVLSPLHRTSVLIAVAILIGLSISLFFLKGRNPSPRELTFTLPDRTFRFEAVPSIPLAGNIGNFALGDLDHDGWPDIVIGGLPTRNFAVLMNRKGEFNQPNYIQGCPGSAAPAIADFDGDGNVDIAFACYSSNQAQVWWGDGKGGFSSSSTVTTGAEPIRCVAGDFNRDGISDLIVDASGGGRLTVLLGHRDRTFARSTYEAGSNPHVPFVADLDGDGVLDVVFACYAAGCHNLSLLRGIGDGTFGAAESIPVVAAAYSVFIADLTGDGIPDLFSGSLNGEESFLPGIGNGKFLPAKLAFRSAGLDMSTIFADHGRNYIFDMQIYPAELRMLSFDPQGNVAASNAVGLADNPRYIGSADFNNDGRNDIGTLIMKGNATYLTIYLQK